MSTATSEPTSRDVLDEAIAAFAAHESVLVATDFDGVLAPIVLDPAESRPLPGAIEALTTIAALPNVTVAIASGRDLATLRSLTGLTSSESLVLIGSHGAESSASVSASDASPSMLGDVETQALAGATSALERIVETVPGARIERKPAGVVLHTRGLPEEEAETATAAALAVPRQVPGVHAMRGKAVVELTVLDVSKGSALSALASAVNARVSAYFGDDVTDETAFAVLPLDEGHLTVKVGDGETEASYRIASCHEVPTLLDDLAAALCRDHPQEPLV